MSDAIKWGLLLIAVGIIGTTILGVQVFDGIDTVAFNDGISTILSTCGRYLMYGRGFVNNFLTSAGRTILTHIMIYILAKPLLLYGTRIVISIYHFIFK